MPLESLIVLVTVLGFGLSFIQSNRIRETTKELYVGCSNLIKGLFSETFSLAIAIHRWLKESDKHSEKRPQIRIRIEINLKGFKALISFLKVKLLRVRNIFLSVDEREEWLGDLKESVNHMSYVERRSKWYIKRYVLGQHIRFGWSKLEILVSRLFSKISRS